MNTTYCVKCKKYTANIDPKMFRTNSNRLISVCRIKKSRFVTRSKRFIE